MYTRRGRDESIYPIVFVVLGGIALLGIGSQVIAKWVVKGVPAVAAAPAAPAAAPAAPAAAPAAASPAAPPAAGAPAAPTGN